MVVGGGRVREIRSLRLEKRSGSLNARDGVAAMDGDWLIKLIEFQFESSFLLVSSSSNLNQNREFEKTF